MVSLEVVCGHLATACGIALSFLRIVGFGADLHGGLSQPQSIMAVCCPPAALPDHLGSHLFPVGLQSAKGIMCSPLLDGALSRPAECWGQKGCWGWGPAPNTAQTDTAQSPKALFPSYRCSPNPFPYKPNLPVPPPSGGSCLVCGYVHHV